MAAKTAPVYDEEIKIDIGKYVEILVRQWVWILICALALGVIAGAISFALNRVQPSYEATALVASSKTISIVNFGGAITSQSETDLASSAASGAQYLYDRKARLQSYVALVRNGNVAEEVLKQVGPKLKPEERNSGSLLKIISGALVANTDSIQISATYADPAIAAEIANAWAQAYVQQINNLYGDASSGISAAAIQAQSGRSKVAYDEAQKALADFEIQNKTGEYSRQIDELTIIVISLRESLGTVAGQQIQYGSDQLKQAYTDKLKVEEFLQTVSSMRDAVIKGGESAAISNSLALTLLKTQIYAAFPGSTSLQVQNLPESMGSAMSTVNAASMAADLEALTTSLSAHKAQLDELIATTSAGIQSGTDLSYLDDTVTLSAEHALIEKKITESEQKIRDLNSLISDLTARENELTRARDLAWQSYSALSTKGTEISVAAQTTGSEVVFASMATPPIDKKIRSSVNIAIACATGLLIGILSAYAYELWQAYKKRKTDNILRVILNSVKGMFTKKQAGSPQKAVEL